MSISKTKLYEILYLDKVGYLIPFIFVFLGTATYLGYKLPIATANLFEVYGDKEKFLAAIQLLAIIYLSQYLNRVFYQLSINKFIQYSLLGIRKYCYESWMSSLEAQRSNVKTKEFPLGEVMARIMNDSEAIRELVTSGFFGIIIDVFFIGSCLVSFITLDSFSGSYLILSEVLAIALLVYASRYMANAFLKVRKEVGILSRSVANITGGFAQNYFNTSEQYAKKKIEYSFRNFLKEQLKANIYDAGYYSVAESLYPLFLALVGVVFSFSSLVKGAVVIALIDLIQRSIGPIKDITGKLSNIQRAYSGFIRIQEFSRYLQEGQSSVLKDKIINIELAEFEIVIDHFVYPKREGESQFELQGIKLQGQRGELIGIVGLSGSGKSTLLKILSCELLADKGYFSLRDINDQVLKFDFTDPLSIQSYREQISLVSQDSHVFTKSFKFNITMGFNDDQKFEKFWKKILLDIPYFKTWQIKPDDILNPSDLSMGQKQLISALRACYLKKPIVLFDEISSGLDSSLETSLRTLVLMVQKQSLTIIVAHRLETIIAADQIIIMDNGALVAQGSHKSLMTNSALYQKFIEHLN